MHAWLTNKIVANFRVHEEIVGEVFKRSKALVQSACVSIIWIDSASLSVTDVSQRDMLYCCTIICATHLLLCRAMPANRFLTIIISFHTPDTSHHTHRTSRPGPRFRHLASLLKFQGFRSKSKVSALVPGPTLVPVAWRRFSLVHRYCSRHVIQCKYGLCSARRTSQAGAALMNESYCCHFGLVFDIKLSLILETWGS